MVGLIGLVILIALITNAVRRRRAHAFDKELIAATQEAANTSANPHLLDDDEDPDRFKSNYSGGYGGGNNNGYNTNGRYSDNDSHGTHNQPPMEEAFMRDMSMGVPVGGIYNPFAGAGDPYAAGAAAVAGGAGAAGIGTLYRARSTDGPNTYAQERESPYPKFAIPPDTYNTGMIPRGQQPYSQQYPQQGPPSQDYPLLGRTKSGSTTQHSSTPVSSNYQQSFPMRTMSPPQNSLVSSSSVVGPSTPSPNLPQQQQQPYEAPVANPTAKDGDDGEDDAYGGYVVESPTAHAHATDPKESDDDDADDDVMPKRVLKVLFYFFLFFFFHTQPGCSFALFLLGCKYVKEKKKRFVFFA